MTRGSHDQRRPRNRRGFTLVEVLVVLLVMVIAAGLVAPAFFPARRDDESSDELARLVRAARSAAARRGEMLFVRLSPSGAWQMEGAASFAAGDVAEGTLTEYAGPAATIIVSPLGTCAFDVRSTDGAVAIPLDPMTCEVVEQ